jgi:nucleoid-associated protein YgaU
MSRRSGIPGLPPKRHPLAAVARRAEPPSLQGGPGRWSPGRDGHMALAGRTLGLLAVTSMVGWLLTSDAVSGPLAIPLTSLDDLRRWLDDSTAAILPAALLRLAALGLCAYLTLALLLALAAQLVDRRTGGRALRAVRRLLPAALRSLLTGGAQCSLVAASAVPLPALAAAPHLGDPGPTATMTRLDPGDLPTPAPAATPTATMTRLPAAPPSSDGGPTTTVTTIAPTTAPTSLAPVPNPPRASAPAIPPGPDDETWTVTPGDTFWSIAEEALTDRRGSFPTQHEIVRYWRRIVATNQSRLAAPGNPDLLLPGQSLVLPPPD